MANHSNPTSPTSGTENAPSTSKARRAVSRAFLGFWIDYYDIYLPIVALAPVLSYFQPENLDPTLKLSLFYLTFAVTLIARPIGAAVFGNLADTIGRRRMTLVSMVGFGITTLLIACIPGYATIGIASYLLLVALRFIDGLFLGGEYTSANPLAMEATPRHRRGLFGALIGSAYPTAYISISIVTAVVLLAFPNGEPDSPYARWGWRIPFIVGGLLALLVALHFRRIEESEVWQDTKKKIDRPVTPFKELLKGQNLKTLGQVMVLMTGLWLVTNSVISAAPALFINSLGRSEQAVTNAILVINFAVGIGYISSGVIGQAIGRRRYFIGAGVLTVVIAVPSYYFGLSLIDKSGSFITGMAFYAVALVLSTSCYGVIHTYIIERFPTEVRASGYGIGYSFAIILPSFYGFYMAWLENVMPYRYTPLPLLALGGIFMAVGAWIGPETRNLDFGKHTRAAAPAEQPEKS